MATFTVKKDQHDFKPNPSPLPFFGSSQEFLVTLTESMWWSVEDEDYPWGKDIFDWNKLFGLTGYFSPNNKNSAIWAWRPYDEVQGGRQFEIVPYINNRDGSFQTGTPIVVNRGDVLRLKVTWKSGKISFFHQGTLVHQVNKRRPWFFRRIGAWFGGNRAAHKDMTLEMTEV